jgi:RES domain-containing protein
MPAIQTANFFIGVHSSWCGGRWNKKISDDVYSSRATARDIQTSGYRKEYEPHAVGHELLPNKYKASHI